MSFFLYLSVVGEANGFYCFIPLSSPFSLSDNAEALKCVTLSAWLQFDLAESRPAQTRVQWQSATNLRETPQGWLWRHQTWRAWTPRTSRWPAPWARWWQPTPGWWRRWGTPGWTPGSWWAASGRPWACPPPTTSSWDTSDLGSWKRGDIELCIDTIIQYIIWILQGALQFEIHYADLQPFPSCI